MTEYPLKRNVAMPTRRGKYPFSQMGINDQFEFDPEDAPRVRSAASWFGKRHNKKFSVRVWESKDGTRAGCWRVR